MKIRTDFVTNSSSSSFTIQIELELTDGNVLQFKNQSNCGESFGPFSTVKAKLSPKIMGEASSLDELISLLQKGVIGTVYAAYDEDEDDEDWDEDDWEEGEEIEIEVFSKESESSSAKAFINKIEKLPSMDAIKRIRVFESELMGGMKHLEEFTYDRDTHEYTGKEGGFSFEEYPNGGCGGELVVPDRRECKFQDAPLFGMTFAITGKVYQFKNREAFKAYVKENGGKVSDSVNVNTDYLVNNDIESTSTKNRTAKALGKPIITEQEFIERFGSPEVQQPTREDSKVEPVFLSGTHIDCAEEEIDAIREYLYKELGSLMEMIHEGQSAVSVSSSPDGLDVSYPIGEIDGYSSVYVQDIAGVFKSLKEKFPHIGILGIAYEYETVSAGTFGPYFYCSPDDKELKVTYEWQRCSICGRIFEKNVYYNSSQWDGGEGNLNCLCSPECMREYVNSNPDYERMVDASESMTEDEQEEYESAFEESDDDIYDIVKSILRKRFYK